jgi:motility quorum-sensing regulator/GCU-specific mRNA interferase toxin
LDKRKPSHDLEAFKAAFARHKSIAITAFKSAQSLGFREREDVVAVVEQLRRQNFVKSVTSFGNHRQWQDVYVIEWRDMSLYLKFTDHMVTEFILLSFKRK